MCTAADVCGVHHQRSHRYRHNHSPLFSLILHILLRNHNLLQLSQGQCSASCVNCVINTENSTCLPGPAHHATNMLFSTKWIPLNSVMNTINTVFCIWKWNFNCRIKSRTNGFVSGNYMYRYTYNISLYSFGNKSTFGFVSVPSQSHRYFTPVYGFLI